MPVYDESSTAYTLTSSTLYNHAYGSANLYGYNVTDNVYLDAAKTIGVTSFPWTAVTSATGLVSLL